MNKIEFPSATGLLEALYDCPPAATDAAVLCHPHPLYGGSMYDGVVELLHGALIDCGIATLRFNFRGVGGSTGTHDRGRGEIDDVLAAADWLRTECNLRVDLIGGYSFGAVVALNTLPKIAVKRAILIAPPVRVMSASAPSVASLVILGERDDIVQVDETARFFAGSTVCRIKGADHFFHGDGPIIADAIKAFIRGA